MKTVKEFARGIAGVGLVLIGLALLACAIVAPNLAQSSNVLTYAAVAMTIVTASTIVFVAPRMSKLLDARRSGSEAAFDRAFASFKLYCSKAVADSSYIQRLLMFIFTVLIIAALVVKGSVAVAVMLSVTAGVSASIKALMRAVASGKAVASDLFVAA